MGIPEPSKLARLATITQPTLVANGDDDRMMITENNHLLAHRWTVRTPAELVAALDKALERAKPTVIEAIVTLADLR